MSYELILGLGFIFVVFIALVAIKKPQIQKDALTPQHYEYEPCTALMTKAEIKFYQSLTTAVDGQYLIFTKVRIADVLQPRKNAYDRSTWWKAFNAISSKHFDYVLCDPTTLEIKMVIELDDSSHNSKSAIKRDLLVNNSCESALLKLVRFKVQATYDINMILKEVISIDSLQISGLDE